MSKAVKVITQESDLEVGGRIVGRVESYNPLTHGELNHTGIVEQIVSTDTQAVSIARTELWEIDFGHAAMLQDLTKL